MPKHSFQKRTLRKKRVTKKRRSRSRFRKRLSRRRRKTQRRTNKRRSRRYFRGGTPPICPHIGKGWALHPKIEERREALEKFEKGLNEEKKTKTLEPGYLKNQQDHISQERKFIKNLVEDKKIKYGCQVDERGIIEQDEELKDFFDDE